ncbi:hypothetical protein [Agrobacterium sp. CG674]
MAGKEEMFVKVIRASKSALGGSTLFTVHARYPRIFHSELMTHRDFSRNAGSSRAKPIAKVIAEVWNKPFIPWHWGANQKGMQAGAPITGWKLKVARGVWVGMSKVACVAAYALDKLGFHKQIPNRLLEPFTYIDVLISSTKWDNFLWLRDHKDAEPHFQDLAAMFRVALEDALPEILEPGQWHLPYVAWEERRLILDVQQKLSVARCARISYTPFDGDPSIEKELQRYNLLVGSSPLHASPAEHQATPDTFSTRNEFQFANEELSGNFDAGWIQYRKTLKGEVVRKAA